MNTSLVRNVISENDTGYIMKERLEEKLRHLFHKEIRVRVSRSSIPRGPLFFHGAKKWEWSILISDLRLRLHGN